MKYVIFFLGICLFSCENDKRDITVDYEEIVTKKEVENTPEISLEIHDFSGVEKYLNFSDEKIYVINFWATWCAPCIKELPYFEKLGQEYDSENVEIILISLDFPKHYDSKLKPFIVKNKLQSKVVVLNDVDSNSWIPKVSENWSGAIPATIIYNSDKRQFYEQSFNYKELETELKHFLK